MPSKKEAKILPAGVVIVIGIAFIFLFFTTTTLTITQVRTKNAQQKEALKKQEAKREFQLEIAVAEEIKKQNKMKDEKNGVLISASEEEIIIETKKLKEGDKKGEILKYQITEKTIIILTSKSGDDENDTVGTLNDLKEGDVVSVRKETLESEKEKAKIIRIFK